MFTGLVEDVGKLISKNSIGKAAKLRVETNLDISEITPGDSVAVNGACLTVEEFEGSNILVFHTLNETLKKTNLHALSSGDKVNLERALRLGDRLGGHLVSGHIDTYSTIKSIKRHEDDYVVTINLPDSLAALVIPKGSIAVNGISLTIAELGHSTFSLHIIPHTFEHTSLQNAKAGDLVNLEADMIGKYILRGQQVAAGGNVSMDSLMQAGF